MWLLSSIACDVRDASGKFDLVARGDRCNVFEIHGCSYGWLSLFRLFRLMLSGVISCLSESLDSIRPDTWMFVPL